MALSQIKLAKPGIGSAPCTTAGCQGTVGAPVWLWTTQRTWVPQTATASVQGVTVTVSAQITGVTWDMGDGGSVTCTTPGTVYDTSFGITKSPDCGYMWTQPSDDAAGGLYTIGASMHYAITWTGAYQAATTAQTHSTTAVKVGEYQSVVTG